MKKGELGEETFSFLDNHRFNDSNYLLVVRDQNSNTNVLTILNYDNGKVFDINTYEMGDKIWTTPNNQKPDIPRINSRFLEHQLLKICELNLVHNPGHLENENRPKSKTYDTTVHELNENEIIEIFEGVINEENAVFQLKVESLNSLLKGFYLQTNNVFFILSENTLKGPFKVKNTDSSGRIIVEKSLFLIFGIYKINENTFIEFEANDILRRIIVPSINELILLEKKDFLTNLELISKFENQLTKNPELFSTNELEKYIELTRKVATGQIFENTEYQKRIEDILKRNEGGLLNNISIAKLLPELTIVKNEIDILTKTKFDLKNEIDKDNKQKENIQEKIDDLKEIKIALSNEIENLENLKEEELKLKKYEIENQIEFLELKKASIDQEIEKEIEEKSISIKQKEHAIEYLQQREESLKVGIKTLQEQFTSEQKSAHQKLQDLLYQNQHYNILSGREINYNKEEEINQFTDYQISINFDKSKFDKLNRYNEIKAQIVNILTKNNRKFESHFIDNILISIHQNTLTLFAGLPGTGKTTLVRLLMNILSPQARNLEIPVSRGWTSQKDLIGFFNPLSKKFHSSSTNLYSLLQQLNWEQKENRFLDSPLCYVLLDEANLSPMEHYWSVFYNLTDSYASENRMLLINLGDKETIKYANNLRFIGTINYDQTTEELSPRVIDRANIIKMDNNKSVDISVLNSLDIQNIEFSFRECIEIFGLIDFTNEQSNIILDEEFETKLNDIKEKFKELKIFISPRVEIAIKQYCKVAKSIMYEQNKPLDYCIAQRLLPLIKVQGNNAKQRLKDLKTMFDDNKYEISSNILKDILQAGEEGEIFQDNFNYFLTLSHV
jgi:DNA polymerase III delta prime subunit